MATVRNATTRWEGSLMEGAGRVTLESSGLGTHDVTWASRANDPEGRTSPEELIAAAHSSCFSMALSHALAQAGTPPQSLDTSAAVTFQPRLELGNLLLLLVCRLLGHLLGFGVVAMLDHDLGHRDPAAMMLDHFESPRPIGISIVLGHHGLVHLVHRARELFHCSVPVMRCGGLLLAGLAGLLGKA